MQKHRFDPISFVFGVAFVALAALFVIPADPWDIYFEGAVFGWVWPLVITGAGIALLAPLVRNSTSASAEAEVVED